VSPTCDVWMHMPCAISSGCAFTTADAISVVPAKLNPANRPHHPLPGSDASSRTKSQEDMDQQLPNSAQGATVSGNIDEESDSILIVVGETSCESTQESNSQPISSAIDTDPFAKVPISRSRPVHRRPTQKPKKHKSPFLQNNQDVTSEATVKSILELCMFCKSHCTNPVISSDESLLIHARR
jgi:hypothetical protein